MKLFKYIKYLVVFGAGALVVACNPKSTGNEFTVNFDGNGGVLVSGVEQQKVKQASDIVAPVYNKSGYKFNNWSVELSSITKNTDVQASWNETDTNITIDGFTRDKNTFSANADNNITTFTFTDKVHVKNGSTWKLYADVEGQTEIPTKTISLNYGNNEKYILVTATNGDTAFYNVNIRRLKLCTVNFYTHGGTSIPSQSIQEGGYAIRPQIDPTRTGYTFIDWDYDFSKPITDNKTIYAKWLGDETEVTLHSNGESKGTITGGGSYRWGDTVTIKATPSKGYYFDSWYTDPSYQTKFVTSETAVFVITKHSMDLYAKFVPTNYYISYVLNEGVNDPDNPSSYTVEDNIIFKNPTKEGYTFQGWYKDDTELITSIPVGSTGNYTVHAHWGINSYKVAVSSNDTSKGTVSGAGTFVFGNYATVVASPKPGYILDGWYSDSTYNNKVSAANNFTFKMGASNLNLYAKFVVSSERETWNKNHGVIPVISEDNKTLTYGLYPQTHVSDESIISELDKMKADLGTYIFYNDEYYVKGIGYNERSTSKFKDNTSIVLGKEYYFKCEPITWNILSKTDSTYIIDSKDILFTYQYHSELKNVPYSGSAIRSVLNNEFYNHAFLLDSSLINESELSDVGVKDKVYIGNETNYLQDWYKTNAERVKEPQDYYLCYRGFRDEYNHGQYWTRTATNEFKVQYINQNGYSNGYSINGLYGVAPTMQITIQ